MSARSLFHRVSIGRPEWSLRPFPDRRRRRSMRVRHHCETVDLLLTGDIELSTVAGHAAPDLHATARQATAVRTVPILTVTLDDLLDEHAAPGLIDFMSVDTEGTELRILNDFIFSRHKPRLVAVEHNRPRNGNNWIR